MRTSQKTSQNSQKAARPDYSIWFTKQQAADAIGVSTKTVEKFADEKKLQRADWKRPETGATVAVYHPGDVERLRKERNPDAEPFMLPPAREESSQALTRSPQAPERDRSFLQRVAEAAAAGAIAGSGNSQKAFSEVRLVERLFLSIPEAAVYSGLPQTHLRHLMASGKLEGLKTGAGWRIRRTDLEKL